MGYQSQDQCMLFNEQINFYDVRINSMGVSKFVYQQVGLIQNFYECLWLCIENALHVT